MSEEELLEELEDNIPYDYCRSEGTEDNTYQEWIDEDSWQFQLKLLVENKNKEIERLSKKLEYYKRKNEKVFKIIDNAMTEQMITGDATINLIELYAILKEK